jgi:TP901 family phage tail tape measure protein
MADNLITTNITAHADFTSLRTQLAAVTAQLVKLQETTAGTNAKLANQIAVMNKSFAETMRSTGQFSSHFVSLSSDVDKFGKNLDRGRLKLNDYYNAWNGHTKKTSNLIRDLAKQQVMLQQAIVQPVGKNAQGLMQYNIMVAKGLDEVKNKMALARQEAAIMNKVMLDGSNQLINWGKNTQWAGRQLTVGLTVPLAAFGMAAQKAFREADAELVRLTKVYGGLAATSSADLAQVRKDVTATAKEIASSYGVAYKETIALAADLAATGQQGNDLIKATQQTTRLAVLGEVDRQDAMKATLAIQNAFKQNTEELTQSIDFLNAVENQTSTSLADLTEAIPKAGPVIKSLGGDVKDLALYLTAMKEGGVNAAEGANAIKSAMASLINPTKVATGLFASFGIDLKGIVNSNAGDLTATIMALQAALDKLNPLDKSRAIEQLFGKFQFARMSALFENLGKQGSQTLQVMDLMKASAVDLAQISERELKMMTESASGQFKRAWASVQADLAQTGEQFLRISTQVLKVVDSIIKFFQNLPGPVKTFLNALGGLTAIAGPLIMMAGVMGNFIGYVVKGIFHLRQLAKGGQGFKLLTPEIMAAEAAAKGLATSFYSDSEATIVLSNAVNTLTESFNNLELKANAAKVAVQPAISTVAGGVISAGGAGQRVVDKNNPLIGAPYSRDMSHLIPAQSQQMGTIFGTVPGAGPVNVRIGKNPQAYMNQDMPKIPGVTSVNGTSTGIVAQEAAKWHAMTAAIAMQSEAEIKILKAEVMATGTVTSSLADSYQALLPQFSEITQLAAAETEAIVAQLQASKITVDQARAKVMQMNATVEAMLAETAAATAAGMGRVANLTTVPLTSQPVVDPLTGKSNMKEMFHKGTTKDIVDKIARALGGVRTSGAGYNIQTTKPKFADGGIVPGTGNSDTYHTTAEAGSFVINKKSTQENMPIISNLLGGTPTFADGGKVPVVLTPGEAVIPADIAQDNMPLMHALNGGPGNTSGLGRSLGGGLSENLFTGLKAWLTRNSDPSYDASLKNRVILHDAAVLNHLGFSEDEAVSMAKRDFEEAMQRTKDPKTGQVDRKAFNRFRIEQSRRMQEYIDMQGMGRTVVNKDGSTSKAKYKDLLWQDKAEELKPGGRPSANARIQPSRSLVAALMARADIDQVSLQRVMNTFTSNGKLDYASEHLDQDRNFFTEENGNVKSNRTRGNAYLAMAGSSKVNNFTNWLASMTQGKFVDRVPLTGNAARETADLLAKELKYGNAQNLIKRMPVIQRGHMITQMMRLLLTRGRALPLTREIAANSGGQIPGKFAQRLFGGGRAMFLGMPKTIKQVEQQRAMKLAMEKADIAVKDSRFAKHPVTEYGDLLEPTSGRSFPVPGIGGVYTRNGEKVFVKPMLDEKAALAEMRATQIAREAHGLKAPKQSLNVMRDPTDPKGLRKLLVLESPFDKALTVQDGKFTTDEYFRQLLASSLRGDKDLGRGNLSGNVLSDVGTAGVFSTASGLRDYAGFMPSVGDQAMVNLLGIKGSGAKKFFAESTMDIPKGMTPDAYNSRMLEEIEATLPRLKKTIGSFDLNQQEKVVYAKMIKRLEDARDVKWRELHGVHSAVVPSKETNLTPAALAKIAAAEELKRRQSGHIVSLSDAGFKSSANGFAIGGMIGNVLKGKAMHRIGAGFGPTGAPKPSMYESAPWGVNSLSIQMAETLFANTGLRKHTQKLFYDKFAAALAKEKPYGYVKMPDGKLKNGLEPDVLDSVIRSAASDMVSDREVLKQLSPIDKDILKQKYLNWDSKKDTPLTESLKKIIFGLEAREKGGPVNGGQAYVVGEKGPELFVPRVSGGIVPNNKYGVGGQIAGGMAVAAGAQFIASKVANPIISMIIQQVGFMLPMMMQSAAMMQGGGGKGKLMSKIPASMKSPIGVFSEKTGGLTKYGLALDKLNTSGKLFPGILGKIGMAFTRFNLIAAAGFLIITGGLKLWKMHQESMRLNALGYGMTAEAAKKAGLKFTDFNKKLKETVADAQSVKERNQMMYESMTTSGTPLKLTIEQYKKLKKEVNSVYKDQIALINKTGYDDQASLAIRLKEQLMSMGMSAEDATAKIYAMYKASNQATNTSVFTTSSKAFMNIKTAVDAAREAINAYRDAVRKDLDPTEQANALNTAAMGIDTAIADKESEAMKARKKDKSKPSFISTAESDSIKWDAENKAITEISKQLGYQKQLSKETLDEMEKSNPALRKIASEQDTVLTLWKKTRIEARGFVGDLSGLSAAQTNALYALQSAVAKGVETTNRGGILKAQYAALDKLKGLQEKYQKALKGQSVAQQISDRDRLAAINKQIDANNKLAEARKKALQDKKNEQDSGRAIEAKKLELQNAEATGNTAGAQQARLDLEGLVATQQYDAQIKAIDAATEKANAPLKKAAEAMAKKQQDLGDAAAYAGEKLGDVTKDIETSEGKIEALNKAMTTYRLAIEVHKDDLTKWKTTDEAKGMLAAITQAATNAKVDMSGLPKDKDGNIGIAAGEALFDKISSGLEASLKEQGIVVNGDVIINGKKIDLGNAGSKTATLADPGKIAGRKTGKGTQSDPIKYFTQSGKEVSKKEYDSMPVGAPSQGQSYIIPDSKLSGKEFANRDAATRAFYKAHKTSWEQGDMTYYSNGMVMQGGKVIGSWLAAMGDQSGRVKSYKDGGLLSGPGTGTSDSIYMPMMPKGKYSSGAYVSNGEFVVSAQAVRQPGILPLLERINNMQYSVPQSNFQAAAFNVGSGSTINLTQNIYPSDGMNTESFVRQVVTMTKQAIGQDAKLNAKMVGTKRT